MEEHGELQLVLLAQCDDPDAVEALFQRLQNPLRRYIHGLVGATAADDVLQDVFVTLWQNLKWLRKPDLFRPWAYRIASRACYRHLKRARQWSDRLDDAAVVEDLPSPALCRAGVPPGWENLLDRVSPASRAVLLLHYVEDLSIDETAAILDIGIGTAKSRLAYGLTCLRQSANRKGQPR